MKITKVRVFLQNEEKLKAYASIVFDDVFVVDNLRIIKGDKGLMVCMPSRKRNDGTFKDVAHPITNAFRKHIEDAVLGEYAAQTSAQPDSIVSQPCPNDSEIV